LFKRFLNFEKGHVDIVIAERGKTLFPEYFWRTPFPKWCQDKGER